VLGKWADNDVEKINSKQLRVRNKEAGKKKSDLQLEILNVRRYLYTSYIGGRAKNSPIKYFCADKVGFIRHAADASGFGLYLRFIEIA
jgi:hypothetical protein